MKKGILCTIGLLILATACNRTKDDPQPANGWKVGSRSYTTFSALGAPASSSGNNCWVLQVQSGAVSPTNGIQFTFGGTSAPVAGTYKIVKTAPAAGQVYVEAVEETNPSGATYFVATGSDSSNGTVTVSSGKVSVNLPDTWAKSISGNDSVKISASITQTN